MKKLILISALLLFVASTNSWAYNETDLAKLRATNACKRCDLSGADLRGANLNNQTYAKTILKNTKLDGAKYCKTQMPWGLLNDDC